MTGPCKSVRDFAAEQEIARLLAAVGLVPELQSFDLFAAELLARYERLRLAERLRLGRPWTSAASLELDRLQHDLEACEQWPAKVSA